MAAMAAMAHRNRRCMMIYLLKIFKHVDFPIKLLWITRGYHLGPLGDDPKKNWLLSLVENSDILPWYSHEYSMSHYDNPYPININSVDGGWIFSHQSLWKSLSIPMILPRSGRGNSDIKKESRISVTWNRKTRNVVDPPNKWIHMKQ